MFRWREVALLCAALGAAPAWAHDLVAEKWVDGEKRRVVDSYPTVVTFQFQVTNVHPTEASILETAEDPLLVPYGWSFTPAPPVAIPVGGSLTYTLAVPVATYQDCLALGGGAGPTFNNVFDVTFDSGSSSSAVEVECLPSDVLPCDETLYAAHPALDEPDFVTILYTIDPATGATTEVGRTPGGYYDALGFNAADGHLYAVLGDTSGGGNPVPRLLKIGADGVGVPVADLPLSVGGDPYAGAFLPDGSFALYDVNSGNLSRVDTTGALLSQVTLDRLAHSYWDFALDPGTGLLWGYNKMTNGLEQVDPFTGATVALSAPAPVDGVPQTSAFAAAAYTAMGTVLFSLYDFFGDVPDGLYRGDLVGGGLNTVQPMPGFRPIDGATCLPPATAGVTRGPDYFAGRSALVRRCLEQGTVALGGAGEIGTAAEAMGVLWASPAFTPAHAPRAPEVGPRVRAARQLLAATCNERLFLTPLPPLTAQEQALTGDEAELRALVERLAAHNAEGERLAVPAALGAKPDPEAALRSAREPHF